MRHSPRHLGWVSAALIVFAAHARARGQEAPSTARAPDTLEPPYAEPRASAAAASPSAPAAAPPTNSAEPTNSPAWLPPGRVVPEANSGADTRPPLPVRGLRRLSLLGEVGWNGLAGFGPVLGFHVRPELTFELGAGISLTGWRLGLRGRYNFLRGAVTPFIGGGMTASTGLGEAVLDDPASDEDDAQEEALTVRVRPSAFAQAVAGVDFTRRNGFTMVGTLGWSFLLNDNVTVVAGAPDADERKAIDVLFRSGPVVTFATGYTFD